MIPKTRAALAKTGTTAEAKKNATRRDHDLYTSPANRNPTANEAVTYRIPLQASATSHFPVGTVMKRPSRSTGTPKKSSIFTADHAEKSCSLGTKASPNGTAKSAKVSGISMASVTAVPDTPQAITTIIATKQNCCTTPIAATCPRSQPNASKINTGSAQNAGVGLSGRNRSRRCQTK